MNRTRQRKLDARDRRQESLHNKDITDKKTVVKLPEPKNIKEKKEVVKVSEVKRGRGRPPKSEQVSVKTAKGSKKKLAGNKEKR